MDPYSISKLSAKFNSARYTQRILQTVKSREADNFSRPYTFSHDTGIVYCLVAGSGLRLAIRVAPAQG